MRLLEGRHRMFVPQQIMVTSSFVQLCHRAEFVGTLGKTNSLRISYDDYSDLEFIDSLKLDRYGKYTSCTPWTPGEESSIMQHTVGPVCSLQVPRRSVRHLIGGMESLIFWVGSMVLPTTISLVRN